ncbi:MAG: hypothetical protein KA205_03325, partial [Acidobacteria bacterium]|nr:hypothetical protein [Acidobacteriota bacterium]
MTASTAVAITRWVDAVNHHVPGQIDDALMSIEKMTADDRAQLLAGLPLFRDGLSQKPTRVSLAAQKRIVDLGNEVARDPGITSFVDRAIMLHGDAAIIAVQRPEIGQTPTIGPVLPRAGPVSPTQQVLERDGELVGVAASNWNWGFARSLP